MDKEHVKNELEEARWRIKALSKGDYPEKWLKRFELLHEAICELEEELGI